MSLMLLNQHLTLAMQGRAHCKGTLKNESKRLSLEDAMDIKWLLGIINIPFNYPGPVFLQNGSSLFNFFFQQ